MDLVTIKTFNTMTSLGILRSYLESEGIECFVQDEFIGTLYGVGTGDLSIKLQVKEADVKEALRLLYESGYARPEDYAVDETMLKLSRYYEKIQRFFKRKEKS
ncbi:MAG: DUF2007 domain-containing protein [Prevotella sp.]|nr:DUF2007 domain-containing protein [Prevotella sp.]